MSYCREEGKDKVIFLTKDDYEKLGETRLQDSEEPAGLIGPNGEINWDCPCLGGMATGPCGVEFREAFSCFHYSTAEPRGSDCYESFQKMHECMQQYPTLYGTSEDEDREFEAKMERAEAEAAQQASGDESAAPVTDREPSSAAAEPHAGEATKPASALAS